MAETFGDYLRRKLNELGIKPAELARRAGEGVTKQNLSRILNNKPHWQTGVAPKPSADFVEKIAKALGVDLDEARLAAGYAPTRTTSRAAQLASLLRQHDADREFGMEGGLAEIEKMSDEEYDALLRSVAVAIEIAVRQKNA